MAAIIWSWWIGSWFFLLRWEFYFVNNEWANIFYCITQCILSYLTNSMVRVFLGILLGDIIAIWIMFLNATFLIVHAIIDIIFAIWDWVLWW